MISLWFSTEFTRFSKSHVLFEIHFCDTAPRSLRFLQKYPQFALRPSGRIGTLQCSPRAPASGGPAKFRWTGGRDRSGTGGGRLEGSLGSISAEVWSGGGAGGVARRRRPVLAVVPPTPARSRPGQRNGRLGKLSRSLGSKFGGGPTTGKGRREEFDAAGPRATAERLDMAEEWPAREGGWPTFYKWRACSMKDGDSTVVVRHAGRDTAGAGGPTRCVRSVRRVQGTGARRNTKPKGLGARNVGKARGGLGKARTGRGRWRAGGVAHSGPTVSMWLGLTAFFSNFSTEVH
jgi:hypothetical protein